MKRFRVLISGLVQGVCFRSYTRKTAAEHKLTGWVRNLNNGKVEAVFEGEERSLSEMLMWCSKGPPAAEVIDVQVFEESYRGEFQDFSILY
jgi:acylphosphatase